MFPSEIDEMLPDLKMPHTSTLQGVWFTEFKLCVFTNQKE
jgi:hypothetical protein